MVQRLILFLLLATLACDDDETLSDSILLAAAKCGQSPSTMRWLDDLIRESEQDAALKGNIYAIKVDGEVIFIHQPMVMSCFACIMYDCNGNRIDRTGVDLQKVTDAMSPGALIYSPF